MNKICISIFLILIWGSFIKSGFSQIDHTTLSPPEVISLPDSLGSNTFNIDIDNDNTDDFYFSVELFETFDLSPHGVQSYRAELYSYNQNDVNVGPFDSGESISSSLDYIDFDFFHGYAPEWGGYIGNWAIDQIPSSTAKYIAVELEKSGSKYYGWIKVKTDGKSITVLSYAIRSKANQSIDAGAIK